MTMLENLLMRDLEKLHGRGLGPGHFEYVIVSEGFRGMTRYLSGVPYPWTTFPERAFVFSSEAEAQHVIERNSSLLEGSRIEKWER